MEQIDIGQELRAMTDGMAGWVGRREWRRTNALRTVALTVAVTFSASSAAMLMPEPSDTFVSGSLSCCTAEACNRVNLTLAGI